jgi:hypothetical protein
MFQSVNILYTKGTIMDDGALIGNQPGTIGALLLIALLFGILYAILIHHLRKADRLDGYAAFAVVGGVSSTIGLAAFAIGWVAAAIILAFFVATGLPMIIGDIYHYTNQRRDRSQELVNIMRGDNGNRP